MKLLFIHDHPFSIKGDKVYSSGSFPYTVWLNYLSVFESVKVIGRLTTSDEKKQIVSSYPNVSFALVPFASKASFFSIFKNWNKSSRILRKSIRCTDIIIIRLPSFLGIVGFLMAKNCGKKIIIEQVGNARESLQSHGSLLGKFVGPLLHLLNKYAVRKVKYVSYVTLNKLQQDYPTSGLKISLSDVVLNKIMQPEELDLMRFNSKKIKIGLIGGFDVRYKGQDILLSALGSLSEHKKKDIELYFVGKGNFEWLLEVAKKNGLLDNIVFIGSKRHGPEIFDFLSSLSLYIQPSLTEGMPRSLLEAMSMGCPVLGSRVGGIPDVLSQEALHEPKDSVHLSRQIERLLDDRSLLIYSAFLSLKKIKPFSKENLEQRRFKFYHKVVSDK